MNKTSHQLLFWVGTFAVLVGLFSLKWNNFSEAFYFAGMLLPVAAGTAYFFIHQLVPQYLWKGKNIRFGIYTLYMLVASAFFMTCISMGSFILLADLQWNQMNPLATDLFQMARLTYFIAILFCFITLQAASQQQQRLIQGMQQAEEKSRLSMLTIRSNRQNVPIPLGDILYIESMADYVKVHTKEDLHLTKEKISKLEEGLPQQFIRIHRSFLVNQQHIERYAGDYVIIRQQELPLGRKYKKEALTKMNRPLT